MERDGSEQGFAGLTMRGRRLQRALRLACWFGAALALATVAPDHARAGATSTCGDGVIEGAETCDDGGTAAGDGCSDTCRVESCFVCNGAPSTCTPAADGAACDDQDACTDPDTCQSGSCQAGAAVSCPSPGECQIGVCDPLTGNCGGQEAPDGTACDDGDPFTGPDVCTSGVCSGPTITSCTGQPDGTPCNDDNLCTAGDSCLGGVCIPGAPVVCQPIDQCHMAGTCTPQLGCSNPIAPNGTPCDDGNACTQPGPDTCQIGVCVGGAPLTCTSLDQCHAPGLCNPATGTCSNPIQPDGTPCNDANLCTQTDSCQLGVCAGSNPVVCTAAGQCFDPGVCDPSTGTCSEPPSPAGTPCDDGDICTGVDSCDGAGSCAPGGSPCGDGTLQLSCGEQCDDGNTVGGDGCSATCAFESSIAQSKAQQSCLNDMALRGANVAKAQNKVARDCVKFAGRGVTAKLGIPATATACLTNDVKSKVQKAIAKLAEKELQKCTGDGLPDYAFTGAPNIAIVGQAEPLSETADLFGPDLSAAIVPLSSDKQGALCQLEMSKRSGQYYDQLWVLSRKALKDALRCSVASPPSSCASKNLSPLPAGNPFELQLVILGYLEADSRGRLAKKAGKIVQKAGQRCGVASSPISSLLPGDCAGAATPDALAACVQQESRCRFCRNLGLGYGMPIDCDDFDDGAPNASCDLTP